MNKKRVKRIGVAQTSLVAGIVMFFISLIFVIPVGLFMGVVGAAKGAQMPGLPFTGVAFLIFIPFLYAIMGFITTAISCLVYNMVAKWTGGVEIEIELADNNPNAG
ncbi:MAG: hypothetical protein P1P82_10175 [Bacteroidales bacterium]|nr:hypothetical protein [Bacteroidales bacterium]MDT8431018.1 hypothetical protein [Bacteroidales bacterium]